MFILCLFCESILIVTCLKMVYDVNEEYEYTPLGQHFKIQCEVLKKTLIYKWLRLNGVLLSFKTSPASTTKQISISLCKKVHCYLIVCTLMPCSEFFLQKRPSVQILKYKHNTKTYGKSFFFQNCGWCLYFFQNTFFCLYSGLKCRFCVNLNIIIS